MKRGFTLVELLVVIAIISVLMAITFPVMRRVREQAAEAECRSNLRQMAAILKTYCNDHDGLFPNPGYLYHSLASYKGDLSPMYPTPCRWHDPEIGPASPLLRQEHPEFQGDLLPYLGDPRILRCRTGIRVNRERGCNSTPAHHRLDLRIIPIVPQYTYTMNGYLHVTLTTGRSAAGSPDLKTMREIRVYRETQVERSPSELFAFGEENSWSINTKGLQPRISPKWPALYDLSGPSGQLSPTTAPLDLSGTISLPSLDIRQSYAFGLTETKNNQATKATIGRADDVLAGDAFATYHGPRGSSLNAGYSYISMLDGHVRKITVADQLRKARQVPNLPESKLGPGGNLYLAWPWDTPPIEGWENQ